MSIIGWEKLLCSCGHDHFQAVYTLQWHENGGTTQRQDGWLCTGCGKRSDNQKMIDHVKTRHLQTKIRELQEQQVA